MTLNNKLVVSASPHDRSPRTVRSLMLDVIIALIPALIASVIFYGPRALLIECVSVATCVIFEYITRIAFKRPQSIGDLSAVITGLLLAFNLPVSIPLWMVVVGALVAIVVAKQFFGGIGQNFVNPALAGRIVLLTSFPVAMSTWTQPLTWTMSKLDGITSASPLSSIHGMISGGEAPDVSLVEMLIAGKGDFRFMIYELLGGGLLLGAIFMATDYTTSPITFKGKIIFGVGCGLITAVIRIFGNLPEGVSYSIIIMNILVPLIENATLPKPFGTPKKEKKEAEAK